MYNKTILILLLLVVPIGFAQRTTASNIQAGDFAIYLLKDDTLKTWEVILRSLDSLTIADHPLIRIDDVVSYDWPNHSIMLTPKGIQKVRSAVAKRTSTLPFPFVVVVGNEKVYLGNMYLMPSSYMAGDIPYIDVSQFTELQTALGSRPTSVKINRAPDVTVPDIRNHVRVYQALLKKNKVKS